VKTLWAGGTSVSEDVLRFTTEADRRYDLALAAPDALASIAHARMLAASGLLSEGECAALVGELRRIHAAAERGEFVIAPDVEDVHTQIETELTARLGAVGGRIHTARSRNDQVLVALALYCRERLRNLADETHALASALLDASDRHHETFLPGYTHMQVAMPSSFGLWFAAYAETFADDLAEVAAAARYADRNPLGSAAGYGSPFPIDRDLTTRLLGFGALRVNALAAQMSRGKLEQRTAAAFAAVAATLGRFASDVVLFLSQNFSFLSLGEAFTTGSSIMPHKKNPDVFELMRVRCTIAQTVPGQIASAVAHLPSGYHRDYQMLKEVLLPRIDDVLACVRMTRLALPHLRPRTDIEDDPLYGDVRSVEAVQALVAAGRSFREAYREVAAGWNAGAAAAPPRAVYSHIGSTGNLGNERIRAALETVRHGIPDDMWERARKDLLGEAER
jgi:argininosuccinate lyase